MNYSSTTLCVTLQTYFTEYLSQKEKKFPSKRPMFTTVGYSLVDSYVSKQQSVQRQHQHERTALQRILDTYEKDLLLPNVPVEPYTEKEKEVIVENMKLFETFFSHSRHNGAVSQYVQRCRESLTVTPLYKNDFLLCALLSNLLHSLS